MAVVPILPRHRLLTIRSFRERATTAREFDPAEIGRGRHSDAAGANWHGCAAARCCRERQSDDVARLFCRGSTFPSDGGALGRHVAVGCCGRLVGRGGTRGRDL